MTTTTATTVNREKFRQVYADAVIHKMTGEQQQTASKLRQLQWHGERVPLAEAAEMYASICDGYNEFEADMLARLLKAYPDAGIEVTPAREYSVVIYLYIPTEQQQIIKTWIDVNLQPKEIDLVTNFTCLQDGEAELDGEALRIWWD